MRGVPITNEINTTNEELTKNWVLIYRMIEIHTIM